MSPYCYYYLLCDIMLASEALAQQYNTGQEILHIVITTTTWVTLGALAQASVLLQLRLVQGCHTHIICQSRICSSASFTTNQPYRKHIQGQKRKSYVATRLKSLLRCATASLYEMLRYASCVAVIGTHFPRLSKKSKTPSRAVPIGYRQPAALEKASQLSVYGTRNGRQTTFGRPLPGLIGLQYIIPFRLSAECR